jgi:ligand-binding SRPBCC domain-containing protein
MAEFSYETILAGDPGRVFEFLVSVRNLPQVMPPSPRLTIVEAPPRLFAGARFTVRVSQFGIGQTVLSEVTWFEEGRGFTDIQLRGPFTRWEHTHTVEPHARGVRMCDRILFEPPRGLLGWILTEARIRKQLAATFAHRDAAFTRLLTG